MISAQRRSEQQIRDGCQQPDLGNKEIPNKGKQKKPGESPGATVEENPGNKSELLPIASADTLLVISPTVMSEIDINLAVLDTILPPGERLRHRQIAEIVGCSTQRIQQIEAKALARLRRKLAKEMPEKMNTRFQSNRQHRAAVERSLELLGRNATQLGL